MVVSTEQQWAETDKQRAPDGQETLAREFAGEFTKHFEQAAHDSGDFAKLDNLFRLSALLRAMHYVQAVQQVELDLGFLMNDYTCQEGNKMPETLPGLVGDKIVSVTARDNAQMTSVLQPLVAGGVTMAMPMAKGQFDKGAMKLLKPVVNSSRAGHSDAAKLWWTGK